MKSRYLSIFILSLLLLPFSSWADDNLDLGTPSRNGQLVDRTGYAFLYSEKHEQPLWVCYKLTKAEVLNKVAKRKDNFRLDPVIKTGSATLVAIGVLVMIGAIWHQQQIWLGLSRPCQRASF